MSWAGFDLEAYDEAERSKISAEQLRRAQRMVSSMGRYLTLLTERTVGTGLFAGGPGPAWSTSDQVFFALDQLGDLTTPEAILSTKGLTLHEAAHIMFSPRAGSPLVTWVHEVQTGTWPGFEVYGSDQGVGRLTGASLLPIARAYNMLEDQRIETVLIGKFGKPVVPWLTGAATEYLLSSGDVMTRAHPFTWGRAYLPRELREALRDQYPGEERAARIADVIDRYRQLCPELEIARARGLIYEFASLIEQSPAESSLHCSVERVDRHHATGLSPQLSELKQRELFDVGQSIEKSLDELEAGADADADAEVSSADSEAGAGDEAGDPGGDASGDGPGDTAGDAPSDEAGDAGSDATGNRADAAGGNGDPSNNSHSDGVVGASENGANGAKHIAGSATDPGAAEANADAGNDANADADADGGTNANANADADAESSTPDAQPASAPDPQSGQESAHQPDAHLTAQATADDIEARARSVVHAVQARALASVAFEQRRDAAIYRGSREPSALSRPSALPPGSISDETVSAEAHSGARTFARELEALRVDHEASWERRTGSGRLSAGRYLRGADLDESFDRWQLGLDDVLDLEVVIALDCSGSMAGVPIFEAAQAMWSLKRAVDQVEASCTVLAFNDRSHTLYRVNDRAGSLVRTPVAEGGTDPYDALVHAERVFMSSARAVRLLIVITDGDWSGPGRSEDVIAALREQEVLTAMVAIGPEAGDSHGCEVVQLAGSTPGLFALGRNLVHLALQRNLIERVA